MSTNPFSLRKYISNVKGHLIPRKEAIDNMKKVEKAICKDLKRKRVEIPIDDLKNRCTRCRIDMGDMNPRQLCGKTYCLYKLDGESSESDTIEVEVEQPSLNITDLDQLGEVEKDEAKSKKSKRITPSEIQGISDSETSSEWIPTKDDWNKIKKTSSFADLLSGEFKDAEKDKMYDPTKYGITDKKEISLLKRIKKLNDEKEPTVQRIINSKWHFEKKAWLMERFLCLSTTDKLGSEYFSQRDELNRILDDINPMTDEDIERYGSEWKWIEKQAMYSRPTLKTVLDSKLDQEEKVQVFSKLMALREAPAIDQFHMEGTIKKDLKKHESSPEYIQLKKALAEKEAKISVKNQIANLKFDDALKMQVLKEYEAFLEMTGTDDESKYKLGVWIDITLSIPTEPKLYPLDVSDPLKIREFSKEKSDLIDKKIYGLPDFKDYIKKFVLQCISSPSSRGNILALCGPPGTGKTTIGSCIAECLDREFIYLSMGGMSSATALIGSQRVFTAAHPGNLVAKFSKLKYSNPVLFIDEIDKAGGTNTKEATGIQGALTHILDPEHNNKFIDEFLGYSVDLSKCIIIVSYNDESRLERQIVDRFDAIYLKEYTIDEKVEISRGYLLPDIFRNLNIRGDLIIFRKDIIRKIIFKSKSKEKGVRQLKRNLKRIVQSVNSAWLLRSSPFTLEMTEFPETVITPEMVDMWFYESKNEADAVPEGLSLYS